MFEQCTKLGGASFTKQCIEVNRILTDQAKQAQDAMWKLTSDQQETYDFRMILDDATEVGFSSSNDPSSIQVSAWHVDANDLRTKIFSQVVEREPWLNGRSVVNIGGEAYTLMSLVDRASEYQSLMDAIIDINSVFSSHTSVSIGALNNLLAPTAFDTAAVRELRQTLSQICDASGTISQVAWLTAVKTLFMNGQDNASQKKYILDVSRPFFFQSVMDAIMSVAGAVIESIFMIIAAVFRGIGVILYAVFRIVSSIFQKVTDTNVGTFYDVDASSPSSSLYVSAPAVGISMKTTRKNFIAQDLPLFSYVSVSESMLEDEGLLQATLPGSESFVWTDDDGKIANFQQYICANLHPQRFLDWLSSDPLVVRNGQGVATSGYIIDVLPYSRAKRSNTSDWMYTVMCLALVMKPVNNSSGPVSRYATLGDIFNIAPDSVYLTNEERMSIVTDHKLAAECISLATDVANLSSLQLVKLDELYGYQGEDVVDADDRGIELPFFTNDIVRYEIPRYVAATGDAYWDSASARSLMGSWTQLMSSFYACKHGNDFQNTWGSNKFPPVASIYYGDRANTDVNHDASHWEAFYKYRAEVGTSYDINSTVDIQHLSDSLSVAHTVDSSIFTRPCSLSADVKPYRFAFCSVQELENPEGTVITRPRKNPVSNSIADYYSDPTIMWPWSVPDKVISRYTSIPSDRLWAPPQMNANLLFTLGLLTTATVAACIFTKTVVMRYIQEKVDLARVRQTMKLNEKREAFINEPYDPDISKDFADAVWKYNRWARIFHWGSYDAANGWFNAPSSSASDVLANPLSEVADRYARDNKMLIDNMDYNMDSGTRRIIGDSEGFVSTGQVYPSLLSLQQLINGSTKTSS